MVRISGAAPTMAPPVVAAAVERATTGAADGGPVISKETSFLAFDIETGPLDEATVFAMAGEFDPDSVKTGNAGPEKRAEKVEAARANHYIKALADAALNPLAGRVLAIGYGWEDRVTTHNFAADYDDGDEAAVLARLWQHYEAAARLSIPMIGFNTHNFDLSFLAARSRLLQVPVPRTIRVHHKRYWNPLFIDLMQEWTFGKYQEFVSLDVLAKAFGVGGKTGDGALFHVKWNGDEASRAEAIEYLRNDLKLIVDLAIAMGVL